MDSRFIKVAADRNGEGQVILDFVVDNVGHVDPASVNEYLPDLEIQLGIATRLHA